MTPVPIPQTDPRAAYLAQKTEIDAAIAGVLESGQYILGPVAERFESDFAAFLGVAHGIGCASGTDAIELALRACGVGAGDLVFTVSHTAVATVAAIERAGATPVLVDIEPDGFVMDPAALDAALRNPPPGRPAAVLPVHLYGEPADLAEIREYGWRERYVSARSGINTRLDPIQAAVLAVKLPRLESDNRRRQAIAAGYDAGLTGSPLVLPRRRPGASHVFHQYVVRTDRRDQLREHLRAAQIGTGIHYPAPVHLHPAYCGRVPVGPTGLRTTERVVAEILSLPIYPQLSDADIARVTAEIGRFFH